MAGTSICMSMEKTHSLRRIQEQLRSISGAEQVGKVERHFDGAEVWLLVYEKYYFRTGGYNSLSVLLTEQNERHTAEIIATGGGTGVANISFGANRKFAKECVDALEELGFAMEKQSEKEAWWQ